MKGPREPSHFIAAIAMLREQRERKKERRRKIRSNEKRAGGMGRNDGKVGPCGGCWAAG